jgi:uncharacterized repeat protein (TIGR02543 family)
MKKKTWFLRGISGIVLATGLLLAGCSMDNDNPMDNDKHADGPGIDLFTGTWTGTITIPSSGGGYAGISIESGFWSITGSVTESGTYIYTGNSATFFDSHGFPVGAAYIETGILKVDITGGMYSGAHGEFTKYSPPAYQYTVTFDAQGGIVSPAAIPVTAGGYVTNLPIATRNGYTFGNWFTQPNGGGSQFTVSTPVNGNITVYAKWTSGGSNTNQEGVYIGIISFAGDASDLTSGAPILLDYSGKNSLTNKINYNYAISSQGGTALFYGVHKALASLTDMTTYPDKLDSVNVVTFTDGLDNGSTGRSAIDPIEEQTFDTEAEYATYVDGQIDSRTINGKPVTAYSVGVRGSDVTNISLFQSNLEKIASTGKDQELTDFSNLQATFTAIADSLQVVHSNTNFNMKTTLLSNGTKVRMTFDVSGTGTSDAAGSSKYIEGTITRTGTGANLAYTFTNITYGGGLGSTQGTGPISGTINGSEVTFAFTGMSGYNPATDESTAKQWTMTSGTTDWQVNSEYSISGATDIQIEERSAIIYLVLDASTSLNSTQIGQIRSAAVEFINSLYDQLNGYAP